MELRYAADPIRFERMNTAELRQNFLIETLFEPKQVRLIYSNIDRMIVGSAVPVGDTLKLEAPKELICDYFTDRREIGIVNIGPSGSVRVDGNEYLMDTKDVLYIGRGNREIYFTSKDPTNPSLFFLTSFIAHSTYPCALLKKEDAVILDYGDTNNANKRKIHCYFTDKGLKSCQLTIGITDLAPGSVWNTMPAHLHLTRSEVYLYFNMDEDTVAFHMLGKSNETRHIIVKDKQAVLSPSWSIHSGVATKNYSFVWCMGGENKETLNIDTIAATGLK